MNLPSVKTLSLITHSLEDARKVRKILEDVRFGPVTKALERCEKHCPRAYGVERIERGKGEKSPRIIYLNSGDPYRATLMYIEGRGFRVGCWGDIVERGKYE